MRLLALLESSVLFVVMCGMTLLTSNLLIAGWTNITGYFAQASILTCFCILSFYYNNLYDLRQVRSFRDFSRRLPASLSMLILLLAAGALALPSLGDIEPPFAVGIFSMFIALAAVFLVRSILYAMLHTRLLAERVLILGTGSLAHRIATEIETGPSLQTIIMGFVGEDDDDERAELPPLPYSTLGPLERLRDILETFQPDRIVVALTERRLRLPVWELLTSCVNGVVVEDGIEVYERSTGKLAIESLKPSALIFTKDFKKSTVQMAMRRVVNLAIAVVALILTAPLMLVIAIALKLDSPGPVLFIQERVGLAGRIFRLIKFRTMTPATCAASEPVWSRDVSSRITRVGKWLRKLSLDELPQFVNILRGDMDLVGPRPEMACNVQTMSQEIPYYSFRNAVRPGLTGWAQIKQGYSVTQEEVTEKIRYDLYYIKHMSLWLDLRILLDTMKIVAFGRGKS